ncbi:phosphopantetheine adenylyltransferase / dephospho-CoA kinase, partial [Paragonimus westermani]
PRPTCIPAELDESKLSSSTNRFRLLGTLLRPVNVTADTANRVPNVPYVIGLTGPSGAGKSALTRRLAQLSKRVHVIDCDRLGHEAYRPGTACHKALIDHFGLSAIASPEPPYPIDRSRLGKLVFSDAACLQELNAIVWPEIERLVVEKLEQLHPNTAGLEHDSIARPIVILDAAVLLPAGWDKICHEVWIAVLPRQEAQRRICERANLDPDAANERLLRQAAAVAETTGGLDWWDVGQIDTGLGPLGRAHVVLSTQWEPECSQLQVCKAFRALEERLTSVY